MVGSFIDFVVENVVVSWTGLLIFPAGLKNQDRGFQWSVGYLS